MKIKNYSAKVQYVTNIKRYEKNGLAVVEMVAHAGDITGQDLTAIVSFCELLNVKKCI